MMRKRAIILAAILTTTMGCSAIKEKIGEFEKQALIDSIAQSVDKKLEKRGLSITTLKQAVDPNLTGRSAQAEVASMAKEAALLEAKRLIDQRTQEFAATHITKDEFGREHESLLTKAILGLFGLISTYLGKQIVSSHNAAKTHANYHARMAVLEALVGKQSSDYGDDDDVDRPIKPPIILPPVT